MIIKRSSIVTTENGLISEPLHLYYLKNFISACRLSMQRVFTTDHGAITEVPYIDIDKVIKHQGKRAPDIPPDLRAKNYERYLAKIHCFVVDFEKGQAFVEVENPIADLYSFMVQKNRQYRCKACGHTLVSNADKDVNGGECPNCHNKTMYQDSKCDIEKNMARFRSLVAHAGGK